MRHFAILCVLVVLGLVMFRLDLRSARLEAPDIATIHEASGVPIRIESPVRMDIKKRIELIGQLEELLSVPATFEIDGRLASLEPLVGQMIEKGRIIARLDNREQRIRVAAAEASLLIANAVLRKARNGARPRELEMARARSDEAAAGLALALEEIQRVRRLLAERAASKQQFDRAKGAHDAAMARKKQADEALGLLKEGVRPEDLAIARARVELARAALEEARLTLDKHELKTPISGVVVNRVLEPGQVVMNMPSPQPIVEISAMDPILFVTRVSELHIPFIEGDRRLDITIDAFPGRVFRGKIHKMSPVGDSATRSFDVEFAVENNRLLLKPGMFGRAKLTIRKKSEALTIPSFVLRDPDGLDIVEGAPAQYKPQALEDDGKTTARKAIVIICLGDRAAARRVRVGITAKGRAEILEGLDETAKVIVDGFEELEAGMKVAP